MNCKKLLTIFAALSMVSAAAAVSVNAATVEMDGSAVYGYNVQGEGIYTPEGEAEIKDAFARTKTTIDLGKGANFNSSGKDGWLMKDGVIFDGINGTEITVNGLRLWNNMYYLGTLETDGLTSITVSGQVDKQSHTNWQRFYVIDKAPEKLAKGDNDPKNASYIFTREKTGNDTATGNMFFEYTIGEKGTTAKIGASADSLTDVTDTGATDDGYMLSEFNKSKTISEIISNDTDNDGVLHVYVAVRDWGAINVSYTNTELPDVAEVDGIAYKDVDRAIEAAIAAGSNTSGGTVELLADCEMDDIHDVSRDITIDGKGQYTLSVAVNAPTDKALFTMTRTLNLVNVTIDGQGYKGTLANGPFHLRPNKSSATIKNVAGTVYTGQRFEAADNSVYKIVDCGSVDSEYVVEWGQYSRCLSATQPIEFENSTVKANGGVIKYVHNSNALTMVKITGTQGGYDVYATTNVKIGKQSNSGTYLDINTMYLDKGKKVVLANADDEVNIVNTIALTLADAEALAGQEVVPAKYADKFTVTNEGWMIDENGKLAVKEEPKAPSATLTAADWDYNGEDGVYTYDGNMLTDKIGKVYYGYSAEITGSGQFTAAEAIATPVDVNKMFQTGVKENLNLTLNNSSVIFYVVSSEILDTVNSSITLK